MKRRRSLAAAVLVVPLAISCGRKGPPLPPLVKLPLAPPEMKAERHGDIVDIQFVVPAANIDGTRPANISRVDVYGLTAARALSETEVIERGTKIASLRVKAPLDPNQTIEPDEAEDVELHDSGLDPGARATVTDRLTPEARQPVPIAAPKKSRQPKPPTAPADGPLLTPVIPATTRVYVGVSVTTKGKNGPAAHAVVAMVDAPTMLDAPTLPYDEGAVTITWAPLQLGPQAGTATDGVLPATLIGVRVPAVAYNVYEVSDGTPPVVTRITPNPVKETKLSDPRMTWGERRCYAVRAFVTIEDASLEGDESPPQCVTLTDTFAPATPAGLQAVSSEAAISLIWDANTEKDVRGYIVLRGLATAEKLEPLMTEPIQETSFQDRTQTGVRFAYAVQAVDTAGNLSPISARVEETAR